MRNLFMSFTIGLLITCLAAEAVSKGRGQQSIDQVFKAFIAALNSHTPGDLKKFIETNCADNVPVDERLGRMQSLVEQGAPFKELTEEAVSPTELKAKVEDAHGTALQIVLTLDTDHKIMRVGVRPMGDANQPPPKDYSGWTSLPALVESIRKDTDCPALTVAIFQDGKLSEATSGTRHASKNDPAESDDVWSIGSIGKPICSTIIGRLIEQGKLRWDETLAEALPGVPMKPGYNNATLEQIMHHRGGIPQELGFNEPQINKIVGSAKTPTEIRWNYALDLLSRDPIADPGKRFAYSNGGYALLGVIAERTTHKPYEALVKELVFKPLALHHSFTGIDTLPKNRPSGHMRGPKGMEEANFTGPMEFMFAGAGGGIYMSAADLARFGQAHLMGLQGHDGLLKAATVERLHQALPGDGLDYACGWGVETFPGMETFHGHNGSNGTFISQLCVFPKAGLVVAAFVNCGGESQPSASLQVALAIGKRYAPNK